MPGDRGPAAAGQQAEPVVEARRDLLDRQGPDPGRGELDREGDPVEAAAELGDRAGVLVGQGERRLDRLRPLDEQSAGIDPGQVARRRSWPAARAWPATRSAGSPRREPRGPRGWSPRSGPPEHDRMRASASSAHSARTGSQSSRTSRSRLPFRWSTIASRSDRPAGSVRPIVLTTAGRTKSAVRERAALDDPGAVLEAVEERPGRAAGRPGSCPPRPARSGSGGTTARASRTAWSISRSRPMKLVTSSLRLLRGASLVRGGGKSEARPGPSTW